MALSHQLHVETKPEREVLTQSILLVSYYAPSRGHAGGLRLLDLYSQIRRINPKLRLVLVCCTHPEIDWGYDGLTEIFDEIYWISPNEFNIEHIKNHKILQQRFDVIDLQYFQSGALLPVFRELMPNAMLIYNPMESQIRAAKLAFVQGKLMLFARFAVYALKEIVYCIKADRVGCVSYADLSAMKLFVPSNKLYCVETGLSNNEISDISEPDEIVDSNSKNERRNCLVFLAYFGSATNRDALRWFFKLVHPLIREKVPSYELLVIGRGIDNDLKNSCADPSVNFIGEVDNISSAIGSGCVGIAPALYGAGIRGKIHQYAALGVPCVASKIAAQSLEYVDGESILLAESATKFSDCCVALLTNNKMASEIGHKARLLCLARYTWDSIEPVIKNIYML
ncbi:hypothetical protein GALL_74960 [mine drainage metagenome]|uniref:Glycosyl transferases group 1 n=1 Tax=mine drainage metagenome TaxID=410659 RepID=A0A1J5TF99_9ZZZZ